MSACHCDQYGHAHPFDRQFCGSHPTSGPDVTRPSRERDIAPERIRLTTGVLTGLRRDNEAAKLKGWRADIGVDDVDLLIETAEAARGAQHADACRGPRGRNACDCGAEQRAADS